MNTRDTGNGQFTQTETSPRASPGIDESIDGSDGSEFEGLPRDASENSEMFESPDFII
jgi:hypothetical protein